MSSFAVIASIIWTALALYGIAVQTINMRWALYKREVLKRIIVPSDDQIIAVRAHIRINAIRAVAVSINLVIGLTSLFVHQQSRFTIVGAIAAVGLLVNEIGWDSIITIEILERKALRRRT